VQFFCSDFFLNFYESGIHPKFGITKPNKMDAQELLKKPIWQMTGEEFLSLSKFQKDNNTEKPPTTNTISDKKLVYGIRGIANLLDCSIATANRIKKSGIIDEAIYQHNRKIVVDSEKALQLFRDFSNNSKMATE
jgi:hypothetical protein